MKTFRWFLAATMGLFLLTACQGAVVNDNDSMSYDFAPDEVLQDFLDDLQDSDVPATRGNAIEAAFFDPALSTEVLVNGMPVQVHIWATEAEAATAAAQISDDGTTIGGTPVRWAAPPHFFYEEQMIVLFLGDDAETLAILEDEMGGEIAGSPLEETGASSTSSL